MTTSKPSVQTLPASTTLKQIIEVMKRDGVLVLSGFIPEDEVDALNAKAVPHFEQTEREGRGQDSFYKAGGRATNTIAAYDLVGSCPEEVTKVLQRKLWHDIMDAFLTHESWDWRGEEKVIRKTGYWLHTTIGYKVHPGANNQALHRDLNSASIQRTGPESLINGISSFVAGTEVTPENGGTHVAPGSHLWPQSRAPKQEDTVAVSMKKGDLALWFSNIFHGAGANSMQEGEPDAVRIIYGLFAITDNFRQGEATVHSCPPEVLKKMPPYMLRLMGFYAGGTGGGRFKGRSPVETWEPLKDYAGGEWFVQNVDKALLVQDS